MKIKGQIPNTTYNEVLEQMLDASQELLSTVEELKTVSIDSANAEDDLARARAKALLQVEGKNKDEREAKVDHKFADERKKSLVLKATKEALLEKVRSQRQVLSALQTYVNTTKAEINAFQYGQDIS